MEYDGLRSASTERGEREAATLILPRSPAVEFGPRAPTVLHPPLQIKIPTDSNPSGVFLRRIVNLKHDQFGTTVAVEIGHRNPSTLVEPGKPIDFKPITPAIHQPVGGESIPHSIETLVRAIRIVGVEVVDMEDDQIGSTVAVHIRHGYGGALIAPRNPSRDLLPVAPSPCDMALRIQPASNAVEALVRSGHAMLDLEDDQP